MDTSTFILRRSLNLGKIANFSQTVDLAASAEVGDLQHRPVWAGSSFGAPRQYDLQDASWKKGLRE